MPISCLSHSILSVYSSLSNPLFNPVTNTVLYDKSKISFEEEENLNDDIDEPEEELEDDEDEIEDEPASNI